MKAARKPSDADRLQPPTAIVLMEADAIMWFLCRTEESPAADRLGRQVATAKEAGDRSY